MINKLSLRVDQKQFTDLILLTLTIVLFYLSFPSGGMGYLAWFAIVPILIALNGTHGRYAFMLGLTAATFGWFCSIWWVIPGIAAITSSSSNIIIPFVFIFCVFCALPYAIGTWLYVTLKWNQSFIGAIKAAILFTVLVNYIPSILPGNMAHALYLYPEQIQFADVGGVSLVFFVIHAVNFLLAGVGVEFVKNKKKSLGYFTFAILLFLINVLYGVIQLSVMDENSADVSNSINIAMIQPNIDTSLRTREDWLSSNQSITSLIHSPELLNEDVDLIVFPEVPVPLSFEYFKQDSEYFKELAHNKALLLTAIEPVNQHINDKDGYFNTIEFIKDNQVIQRYQKQKLLPMGEYLPFEEYFPWVRKLLPYAPNYKPGDSKKIISISDSINIIPLICYEAVFTELVAESIALEGNIMVNTVNDAWFANTAGVKIHLALALFRAIEYRTPLVRSTNTGISSVINAQGLIIENSLIPNNQIGMSITSVKIKSRDSFYQMYPNFIKIFFITMTIISVLLGWRKVKKNG